VLQRHSHYYQSMSVGAPFSECIGHPALVHVRKIALSAETGKRATGSCRVLLFITFNHFTLSSSSSGPIESMIFGEDMFLVPLLVAFTGLATYLLFARVLSQKNPRPPGPKPKFLIGNVLDMPKRNQADVYIKWEDEYGSESPPPVCQHQDFMD